MPYDVCDVTGNTNTTSNIDVDVGKVGSESSLAFPHLLPRSSFTKSLVQEVLTAPYVKNMRTQACREICVTSLALAWIALKCGIKQHSVEPCQKLIKSRTNFSEHGCAACSIYCLQVEDVSRPTSYPTTSRRSKSNAIMHGHREIQSKDMPRSARPSPRSSSHHSADLSAAAIAAAAAYKHGTMVSAKNQPESTRLGDYVPGASPWGFDVHLPRGDAARERFGHQHISVASQDRFREQPRDKPVSSMSQASRRAGFNTGDGERGAAAPTGWLYAGLNGTDQDLEQRIYTAGTPRDGSSSCSSSSIISSISSSSSSSSAAVTRQTHGRPRHVS